MRPFERSLPMALLRAREAVMRGFRQQLREQGLNEQEWRIMRALMEVDKVDIGELAECVFILKPSATRTIKNLEGAESSAGLGRAPISAALRSRLRDRGRRVFDELAPHSELEYARITELIGAADMQESVRAAAPGHRQAQRVETEVATWTGSASPNVSDCSKPNRSVAPNCRGGAYICSTKPRRPRSRL